ACVAIAPTCGSANGTTEPTDRNFDCTETPHCSASRSQATIEYVATTGLAIGPFDEVDLQQLFAGHQDAGYFRAGERRQDLLLGVGPDDDRRALLVRAAELLVVHRVEHERLGGELDLTLDRALRDALL